MKNNINRSEKSIKREKMKNSAIKKTMLAVCFIAITCACYAQDIIVTKDSRRYNALVTEVNPDNVRFRLYDNQDGPVYSLPKSDIVTIIYRNGYVETFQTTAQPAQAAAQAPRATTQTQSSAPGTTTASTYSQDARWGIRGGINGASEITGKGETGTRLGIHVGAIMEKAISRGTDIQLGFLYSMQGATTEIGSTTYTDMLDYINIPLIFKFYVNKNRRFSIDAGPQVGYMISAKLSYGSSTKNVYNNKNLQKIDASIGLGISYKFNNNLDLIIRGTGGLTKIFENLEHKNSVVQIGVGYRF